MPNLERIVQFEPAYDKRSPDPEKNYGIRGVMMRMVLKGPEGAVQFLVYTNWQLPHITKEAIKRAKKATDLDLELKCFWQPMAADLGYHSKTPMYEGQEPMGSSTMKIEEDVTKEGLERFQFDKQPTGTFTPCEFTDGPCYYDGSGLHAERVFDILVSKGGEAVWKYMEECYYSQFGGKP
jgi:hypothetical protein